MDDPCPLDCPSCGTCEAVVLVERGQTRKRLTAMCVRCGRTWRSVLSREGLVTV